MRCILVHHHIFKNAGTTIAGILDKNFGSRFSNIHGAGANGIVTRGDLLQFLNADQDLRAVTSHHFHIRKFLSYDAAEFMGDITLIDLVLIRHPISRLVSMYEFQRRGGGGDREAVRQARELSLAQWLEMLLETKPHLVNDCQVSVLAKHGYYASPPSRRDLKAARRKLRDFALIGTVESFDEFCVCAEYFLQPAFGRLDFTYEILNRRGAAHDIATIEDRIGLPLLSELSRLNGLDMELWKFASEELDRRFSSVHRPADRIAAFRKRLGKPVTERYDADMSMRADLQIRMAADHEIALSHSDIGAAFA